MSSMEVNTVSNELQKSQRLLVGHGALVLLFGFVVGFGFLFFLIGEISLWPIPGKIDYQLPGTYDGWRMAHLEGISNGMLLWILAAVLPILQNVIEKIYRVALAMVVVAWTIVLASLLDPLFPEARGLAFSADSNLANGIAFFLFYIGIVTVMVVVTVVAVKSLRASD
jgi:hypothetical protein